MMVTVLVLALGGAQAALVLELDFNNVSGTNTTATVAKSGASTTASLMGVASVATIDTGAVGYGLTGPISPALTQGQVLLPSGVGTGAHVRINGANSTWANYFGANSVGTGALVMVLRRYTPTVGTREWFFATSTGGSDLLTLVQSPLALQNSIDGQNAHLTNVVDIDFIDVFTNFADKVFGRFDFTI